MVTAADDTELDGAVVAPDAKEKELDGAMVNTAGNDVDVVFATIVVGTETTGAGVGLVAKAAKGEDVVDVVVFGANAASGEGVVVIAVAVVVAAVVVVVRCAVVSVGFGANAANGEAVLCAAVGFIAANVGGGIGAVVLVDKAVDGGAKDNASNEKENFCAAGLTVGDGDGDSSADSSSADSSSVFLFCRFLFC